MVAVQYQDILSMPILQENKAKENALQEFIYITCRTCATLFSIFPLVYRELVHFFNVIFIQDAEVYE